MTIVPWRLEMYKAASQEVAQFIRQNPAYSLRDDMQPLIDKQIAGWCVNFVLWGYCRDRPVVFKYFHEPYNGENRRWENEYASLLHFADTGLVPEVLAIVPRRLIVMVCLPGRAIVEEAEAVFLDRASLAELGREAGRAVGQLLDTPLPTPGEGYSITRDYAMISWQQDLVEAVHFYLRICWRDREFFPAAADPFYGAALTFVENLTGQIKNQRRVIHNDDLLCFVYENRIVGFYDFELSRLGTEQMQLGQVFRWCSCDGLQWSDVLEGYCEETGRSVADEDYAFMLAMNLLHRLIRIARWGKPDVDSDYVAEYLPAMKAEARRFADYVDLALFFPSRSLGDTS